MATCLVVSIITQYTPLIVISTAGAASAASYVLLNVWQTVRGGKHRFVDRADWEMWYLVSHAFIWAGKSLPPWLRGDAENGRWTGTEYRADSTQCAAV